MYAVFQNDGKQYKVKKNDIILLTKIDKPINKILKFNKILIFNNKDKTIFGQPTINNIFIEAKILNHIKGKKIKIIKFNRRKHYRKKQGYRQYFTKIQIININI